MALERSEKVAGTLAAAGMCSGELGSEPICCTPQTVMQCQFCTWSPGHLGKPALVLQNFTLRTLSLTVSKVSCVDGFPSTVLHLRAASHTLNLSSRSCPYGVGCSPAYL